MIKKLFQSLSEKAEIEFWSSNQKTNLRNFLLFVVVLFLPTQFGAHFWPDFAFVKGARIDYLSPTLYFTDILVFFFLILNIDFIWRAVRKFFRKFLTTPLLLVFVGILTIGIFLSKNPLAGIYGLFKIVEIALLILAIAKNIQMRGFKFILPALLIGILFESVLVILQFQNQGSINGIFYLLGERAYNGLTPNIANASLGGELILRPYGTFSHPNVLAGYLVISMFILLGSITKKTKTSGVYFICISIGSLALFLSLSRTAILVWIFLVCIAFLRNFRKAAAVVISFLALFLLFPSGVQRFVEISIKDQSFYQRVDLAKAALKMIYENPFFGVGLNNFLNNLPFYGKDINHVLPIQPVHNIFLLLFAQFGLLLGFVSVYFLYKIFIKTKALGKILIAVIIFLGFFDHYFFTLQQGQLLLALVLGIAISQVVRLNNGRSYNL